MARRTTKKKDLTPEEKLAQALVPVEEQPYRVPGNWCWSLGGILFHPMETKRPTGEVFKYVDIESIDNKRQIVTAPKIIQVKKAPSRASRALHAGDTVFSMVRPYLKNIAYIDERICDSIASTGFYVCTPKHCLCPKYVFYLMVSPYVVDGLNAFMKGDNSPSIRKDDIDSFPFPLPPLSEQQRIVARVESLFAKLDEAKEKAQAVVDGFEERKAAILHKAFTGELTKQWRMENDTSFFQWERTVFERVLDVRDGTHDSPQYHNEGYPLVTSKNLKNGRIIKKDIRYISQEDYEKINERSKVDVGDILFAMIGTIGNPVVIEEEPYFAIKNVALFKNTGRINPYYVKYYLESNYVTKKMKREAKGSTQRFVSLGYLRKFPILCPNEKEQVMIVQILEHLIGTEQCAKTAAEQVLDQIDTMKKAILARAFRGELGTNDPQEESAVELVRRALDE